MSRRNLEPGWYWGWVGHKQHGPYPTRAAAEAAAGRGSVIREVRAPGGWAPALELDECVNCGRSDRPHHAKGLCGPCYRSGWLTERRRTDPAAREYNREWQRAYRAARRKK